MLECNSYGILHVLYYKVTVQTWTCIDYFALVNFFTGIQLFKTIEDFEFFFKFLKNRALDELVL